MGSLAQGVVEEGMEYGRIKIATAMLNDGIDRAFITKYTQFSDEELTDIVQGKITYEEEDDDKESIDATVKWKLKILKEEFDITFDEDGVKALQTMHELHPQLIKNGEKQYSIDIANAMLSDGIDIKFIAKYTQLSSDELQKMRQ